MVSNLDPAVVKTILTALLYRREGDGAQLSDIVAAFPTPQKPQQVQSWLRQLVAAQLVDAVPNGDTHRYYARPAAEPLLTAANAKFETRNADGNAKFETRNADGNAKFETRNADGNAKFETRNAEGVENAEGGTRNAEAPANPQSEIRNPQCPGSEIRNPDPQGGFARESEDPGHSPLSRAEPQPNAPATTDGSTTPQSEIRNPQSPPPSAAPIENRESNTEAAKPPTSAIENFRALFDSALPQIIMSVMPHASALAYLQVLVAQKLPDADRSSFLTYAMDRLSRLTLGECARLGLEPQQYELWRREYAGPTAAEPPATAASAGAGTAHAASPANTAPMAPVAAAPTAPSSPSPARPERPAAAPLEVGLPPSPLPPGIPPPSRAGSAWTDVLTDGIGRLLPRDLDPKVRLAVIGTVAAAALYWFQAAARSPWAMTGIAAALVVGLLVFAPRRRALTPAAPGAQPSPTPADAAASTAVTAAAAGAAVAGNGAAVAVVAAAPLATAMTPATSAPARRSRRWIAAATAVLAAVALTAAGAAFLIHRRSVGPRPPEAEVRAYLAANAGALPVRLTDVDVRFGNATAATCPVTYQARYETTEPLFRRIDTAEYLRTHAAAEMAAIDAAAALLRGADGARIRAAVGDQGPETKDQGAAGKAEDRKIGNVGNEGNAEGETRNAEAPTNPQSAVRNPQLPPSAVRNPQSPPSAGSDLKSQISNLKSGAEAPVLVVTSTPPRMAVVANGSLLAWRREGTWVFSGDPVRLDRSGLAGDPKPEGAFAVDLPDDAARLKARLTEQAAYAARVQAAAKAIAAEREREQQQRTAVFAGLLRPGTLFTGTITDPVRHAPQRIVVEITTATGARLDAVLRNDGGWSDVRPFEGEWTLGTDGETATVVLRTTRGDAVEGAGPLLQDRTDWALVFGLHADGTDVQLETRNAKLGSGSAAAIAAALRRVDAADAGALKAEWTRELTPVLAATRAGAVYRGTALSRIYRTTESLWLRFAGPAAATAPVQGSTFKVQGAVLPGAGASTITSKSTSTIPEVLKATMASATEAGPARAFRGTVVENSYRAGAAPIRLQTADADRVGQVDAKSVLGIATGNGLSLALRLEGDRLVGQDAWFTYEFAPEENAKGGMRNAEGNADGNAEGGTRNADAGKPAGATGAPIENRESKIENPLPPFPTAAGAYALVAGRWVALPHNDPQVVRKQPRIFDRFFSALETIEAKAAGKPVEPSSQIWGALSFDGRESLPWVPANQVVIIYVGAMTPLDPALLKKYPALKLEPPMELGALQTLESGSRSILLRTIYPGVAGFGPQRIEATVGEVAPNVMLLRCTVRPPIGHCALTCSNQQFEVGVIGVE